MTTLVEALPVATDRPTWSLPTRVWFRFTALFLTFSLNGFPPRVVQWVGERFFHVNTPLLVFGGSGDKMFDWVQLTLVTTAAIAATAVWSAVTKSKSHPTALRWFRLLIRLALGTTLISYGVQKAIPLQMPYPMLTRMMQRFGDFSMMGVLWTSIGVSPAYERITGCVEITAGLLLFVPATVGVGAVLSAMCAVQVFVLNMTYDVPVKLFSFQLVVMSLFLLAPDLRALFHTLVVSRQTDAAAVPLLWRTAGRRRLGVVLQVLIGSSVVVLHLQNAVQAERTYGMRGPRSPYYGVWTVSYMASDGIERPPLLTDNTRWRRVVFERPTMIAFQRMDDSFVYAALASDGTPHQFHVRNTRDGLDGELSIAEETKDRLNLKGTFGGRPTELHLERMAAMPAFFDADRFHWIQEYPVNR